MTRNRKTRILPLFVLSLLLCAAMAATALGAPSRTRMQGGFSGPGPAFSTVTQVQSMRDDAFVSLRGNIVQHLSKDKYLFRDSTGTITVEIDNDKWNGQTVGPEDTVEIFGEVDRDRNSLTIDVDRILLR